MVGVGRGSWVWAPVAAAPHAAGRVFRVKSRRGREPWPGPEPQGTAGCSSVARRHRPPLARAPRAEATVPWQEAASARLSTGPPRPGPPAACHTPRPGCCSSGLRGLGSRPECGRVCAHPHSGDTEGCGCSKGGVGEALPLASRAGCPLPAASPAASPQQGQAAGTGPAPVSQLHGASGETPPPRPHVLRTLWPDFLSPVLEVPLAQVLSVPSRCGVPRTRHSLPPAVQSLIHPLVELQLWASRRDGTEDAAEDETRVAPAPVAGRLPGGPRDNGRENKTLWGQPLCRANSGVSEAKAEGRWWGHLHTGRSRRPTPGVGVSAEGRAGAGRGARVAGCEGAGGEAGV